MRQDGWASLFHRNVMEILRSEQMSGRVNIASVFLCDDKMNFETLQHVQIVRSASHLEMDTSAKKEERAPCPAFATRV